MRRRGFYCGSWATSERAVFVRAGEVAEPLTGLAISGNLLDLLKDADALGKDVAWTFGEAADSTPTFRVQSVKIGSGG